MRQCVHDNGKRRCKAPAKAGRDYCHFHDPDPEAVAKRKEAQQRGGKNRQKKSRPTEDGMQSLGVDIPDGKLSEDQLEGILATAIAKGTAGKLSAPVLTNITRLVSIYEGFLQRKKDRGDVDRARKLSSEELHDAMLRHIPSKALFAEAQRRRDRAAAARAKKAAAEPGPAGDSTEKPAGAGGGDVDGGATERPGGRGERPSDPGHTEREVPARRDNGPAEKPPVRKAWRL